MSGGFIEDDDFDKGSYDPDNGENSQKQFSHSILGHKIHPDIFMANEGKRHALGWERLIRECVDSQHDLSPYQAFDTLKIICHSFAMMMVCVSRCGPKFAEDYFKSTGIGISLDMLIKDDWREFDIGSVLRNIANRGKIPVEVTKEWKTMADVDDYMQTAIRPEKSSGQIDQRSITSVTEFLDGWVRSKKSGLRVSVLMEDGSALSGYLKKTENAFGVLKRSDSTVPHMFDVRKIKLIQTTTIPYKTLFSV